MSKKWYLIDENEVLQVLGSSREGLSSQEVRIRLDKDGLNKLKEFKNRSIILKFLDQFKNFMIIVLIVAAIFSAVGSVIENEPFTDAIIILVVVILNALLGVIQENKAEKAIEALKSMSLPYIKVRRNNNIVNVKTEEIVVGDIILIEAGDYIPADIRIIENHSLRIDESALTGESVPVDKVESILNSDNGNIALGDRLNMLYSGSSVVYGRGEGIVTSIGMGTELGKIAGALEKETKEDTPLQKKMTELSKVLSILVLIIAVIMLIVGIVQGKQIIDVFMLAIALAVAAIPEGLAAVITITLAIGVQKMAKEKAIIRKLSAVESLGCTEVICTDKTGTLTQNKMTVRKIYSDNNLIDTDEVKEIGNLDVLSKLFTLCNDTKYSEENEKSVLIGDPTETALIAFGEKLNIDKNDYDSRYIRIEEIPFDSLRKMMTTINIIDNEYTVCVKGAIESILKECKYILLNGEVIELSKDIIENIYNANMNLTKEALRVLAFAYKKIDSLDNKDKLLLETDLIFVGLVGMIDPPRPEAKEAVKQCFSAGIIPVMITGDNIDTAESIAKELGILTEEFESMTGLEVDKLTDLQLCEKIERVRVYARVSPENKIRIVRAWKNIGKTVAMTGDGVNDAPALKGADIGIGMGITGTEVSKSVSSMILSDDNFATIVVAVKEGRKIYTNIQNVISYLLASNLAEILIIFIATLMDKTILLPIQILWINLVTDTIPAIALGFEKEEKAVMKRKPRKASENFFTPFLTMRIAIPAIFKSIVILALYLIVERMYSGNAHGALIAGSAVFVTLSSLEILFAYISRSDKKSVFEIGLFSNIPMIICVISTFALQIFMLCNDTFRSWLKVENMDFKLYSIIIAICILCAIIFEIIKKILAKIYLKHK